MSSQHPYPVLCQMLLGNCTNVPIITVDQLYTSSGGFRQFYRERIL